MTLLTTRARIEANEAVGAAIRKKYSPSEGGGALWGKSLGGGGANAQIRSCVICELDVAAEGIKWRKKLDTVRSMGKNRKPRADPFAWRV